MGLWGAMGRGQISAPPRAQGVAPVPRPGLPPTPRSRAPCKRPARPGSVGWGQGCPRSTPGARIGTLTGSQTSIMGQATWVGTSGVGGSRRLGPPTASHHITNASSVKCQLCAPVAQSSMDTEANPRSSCLGGLSLGRREVGPPNKWNCDSFY